VWVTGEMEKEVVHCGERVERNRVLFSVCYRLNENGRSSVCGTGRMEQEGLQCEFPVEWNKEVFSVCYRLK